MLCPIDQTELKMTERQGVEIDYCPKCRGVWLDRGELDKIIERQASEGRTPLARPAEPHGYVPGRREYDDDDDDDDRYRHRDQHGRKRSRRGWLDDLFDFG
jgi:Zn-finger nucleic acid-binding protein